MSTEGVDPRYADYQRPQSLEKRLSAMTRLSGDCSNVQVRVAVIVGRWHDYIVDRLLQGALDALNESGVSDKMIDIIQAPGAYEIPLIAKVLASQKKYQALVTLGAVIKGETPHFDFVAGECARGLAEVSREYHLPIGFGVLTVNSVDQAMARAADGDANKGREAVMAALEVADLLSKIQTLSK